METRAIIGVIDNLDSDSATDALSANQGRVLNELKLNKAGDTLNYSDLDDLIGKIYVGYGHNLTNAPEGSAGYIINIPNPNNPTLYTKQFYMYHQSDIVWSRRYNNGTWSEWVALNDVNIVTAYLNADITATSNTDMKIPLTLENNVGSKLSISNGGIKIGKGVTKVLVSASVYYGVLGTVGAKNLFIKKNSSNVARKTFRCAGNYDGNSMPMKLLNVQENDILYLYAEVYSGDVVSSQQKETYMTVQVIG